MAMKFKSFIIALVALQFFFSCDDEEFVNEVGNEDESEIEEVVPIQLYVNWDASLESVRDSTKGLQLVEIEEDFLHYYSETMNQTVSYEFTENTLSAVAVVFPLSDSIHTLTAPLLNGFDFVGEKDCVLVYVNESKNMFAAKYQTSELADSISGTYVIVGFTPLAE